MPLSLVVSSGSTSQAEWLLTETMGEIQIYIKPKPKSSKATGSIVLC